MNMTILKMKSQGEGAGESDGGPWAGWSQDLLSMFSSSLWFSDRCCCQPWQQFQNCQCQNCTVGYCDRHFQHCDNCCDCHIVVNTLDIFIIFIISNNLTIEISVNYEFPWEHLVAGDWGGGGGESRGGDDEKVKRKLVFPNNDDDDDDVNDFLAKISLTVDKWCRHLWL